MRFPATLPPTSTPPPRPPVGPAERPPKSLDREPAEAELLTGSRASYTTDIAQPGATLQECLSLRVCCLVTLARAVCVPRTQQDPPAICVEEVAAHYSTAVLSSGSAGKATPPYAGSCTASTFLPSVLSAKPHHRSHASGDCERKSHNSSCTSFINAQHCTAKTRNSTPNLSVQCAFCCQSCAILPQLSHPAREAGPMGARHCCATLPQPRPDACHGEGQSTAALLNSELTVSRLCYGPIRQKRPPSPQAVQRAEAPQLTLPCADQNEMCTPSAEASR